MGRPPQPSRAAPHTVTFFVSPLLWVPLTARARTAGALMAVAIYAIPRGVLLRPSSGGDLNPCGNTADGPAR
jgi:hypothetical protein